MNHAGWYILFQEYERNVLSKKIVKMTIKNFKLLLIENLIKEIHFSLALTETEKAIHGLAEAVNKVSASHMNKLKK